ncbi:NYN domain-containing protein [Diaminobutyricimonas sp. LJ205]|uniref:NYN domain-containing protein n=1 Tax=Diaminobutyricimonas sp. LJ205 TaxID=2683590 RepID=UPI0012F4FB0A|nr:NYN domain-containing protein [Diaminobutyricimonas sp. LJ205]
MADADNRVAVYIDFDNIVISRYNQVYGRGAFQSDRVKNVVVTDPTANQDVVARIRQATVDIGAILDYASSFGPIVISRAYADWSQPVNSGYRKQLIDRAIDLTQMFPLSATKNGADIRLAIDVVEDMFRLNDVTHVVLVAGDSDYVALAQRVKRLGRYIIAVGVAGATSKSLPAACNEFSLYDDLPGIGTDEVETDGAAPDSMVPDVAARDAATAAATAPVAAPPEPTGAKAPAAKKAPREKVAVEKTTAQKAPARKTAATKATDLLFQQPMVEPETDDDDDEPGAGAGEQAAKMSPRAATKLLRRALELGHDKAGDDEWLHTSAVKQQIKRMDPSFHEKSLGYSSFTDFVKSRSNFAEFDKSSNGQRVRMRVAD